MRLPADGPLRPLIHLAWEMGGVRKLSDVCTKSELDGDKGMTLTLADVQGPLDDFTEKVSERSLPSVRSKVSVACSTTADFFGRAAAECSADQLHAVEVGDERSTLLEWTQEDDDVTI